ncbi:MAG: IS5 family transposase [Nanoarchaeota archaeon]|nr:IS5 family transposase [Nanoarchaeota archaeon]
MESKKRWGKKYIDKRNWKEYNEELVLRGVFYIKPSFLETWNQEIREMNTGKVGEPYLYPNSMIEFLAVLSPKYDDRALEGMMRAVSEMTYNFPVISYSQINRRVNSLKLDFPINNENIIIGEDIVGGDASGIKVANRGDWIRYKWKVQRGWIKVVILGNKKGKVIDVEVGMEELDENGSARLMLQRHHQSISKFLGDGWYDSKENFNFLRELKIKPVIKIDKNASDQARQCMTRWKYSQEQKKLGYKKWAKKEGYGYRWVCTEGIFSAVKRMEGEYISATKEENMFHEAKMKFWIYNKIREATKFNNQIREN